MKVYRWEETEDHYIAVVRPDELFDLSTLTQPHPELREGSIKGVHRLTGDRETYADVYGKRKFIEQLVRVIARTAPDVYLEQDERDLDTLRAQERTRANEQKP